MTLSARKLTIGIASISGIALMGYLSLVPSPPEAVPAPVTMPVKETIAPAAAAPTQEYAIVHDRLNAKYRPVGDAYDANATLAAYISAHAVLSSRILTPSQAASFGGDPTTGVLHIAFSDMRAALHDDVRSIVRQGFTSVMQKTNVGALGEDDLEFQAANIMHDPALAPVFVQSVADALKGRDDETVAQLKQRVNAILPLLQDMKAHDVQPIPAQIAAPQP